jgi:hypothetical protein
MKYYVELTQQIYNPEDPRTFMSACIKCHTTRPLINLSTQFSFCLFVRQYVCFVFLY